jgi:hypothetical protein
VSQELGVVRAYHTYDLLLVAASCGTLAIFEIWASKLNQLDEIIMNTGVIFSIKNTTRPGIFVLGCDDGLHFAQLELRAKQSPETGFSLKMVLIKGMSLFEGHCVRSIIQIRHDELMVADYNSAGFYFLNTDQRRLTLLEDQDSQNNECIKMAQIPFYHPTELPFVIALTRKGLFLLDVKFRRQFLLRAGSFRDFVTMQRDEYDDPPAKLIFSEFIPSLGGNTPGTWSIDSI